MEVMAQVLRIPPSFPVPLSQLTLPRTSHWWHPRLSHKTSAQSLTAHYTQPLFPSQGHWLSWREKIHLHTCFEKSGRHSRLWDGFFCPLKPPPTLRAPSLASACPFWTHKPTTHINTEPQSPARGLQLCTASLPGKPRENNLLQNTRRSSSCISDL